MKDMTKWILVGLGLFLILAPHEIHMTLPVFNMFEHMQHQMFGAIAIVIGLFMVK